MTTLLITLSDDDILNSVDYALKKNQFEREFFELKQPAGIVQPLGDNRIQYMKTNEFRDSIAKVKSGRKDAAGSGDLKDFFEVWLKDPNRRTYNSLDFCKGSPTPRTPVEKSATSMEPTCRIDSQLSRYDVFNFGLITLVDASLSVGKR